MDFNKEIQKMFYQELIQFNTCLVYMVMLIKHKERLLVKFITKKLLIHSKIKLFYQNKILVLINNFSIRKKEKKTFKI